MWFCSSQKNNSCIDDDGVVDRNLEKQKDMRMMSNCIREIQAPVSDLCGLQSIMDSIPVDSSIYHYAKCMNTCGILLADMIEKMRLYYTVSSGLYEVDMSSFALRTELEVVWESLIIENERLGKFAEDIVYFSFGEITLTLKFGENVPSGLVKSDSTCVLKIFKSLLENAIRFTLEGEIAVQVYMVQDMLHMVVTDSGVGVPVEAHEAIFEPLTKAHKESIHGGVGMGLPLAKAMCEALGGRLELERSSKSGSTFHACFHLSTRFLDRGGILMKRKTLRRKLAESVVQFDYPVEDNNEPCEMPQLLLVEDVQLNRNIVTRMMREVRVEPSIAEDGVKAVEACLKKKFDLILMDITMPNMGGIEATEEIKKNCPLNKTTPVIALTGTLAGKMEGDCLQAGMIHCIAKPLRKKLLVEYICSSLQRKHQVWMGRHQIKSQPAAPPSY